MEEQATNSSDLARLAAITPHVTDQLQDFCTLALDTIKVYKPELTRLDQKSDGIIKNIKEINATFSQTLVAHESVQAAEARRTSALEERMSKLEALVAVLPTWKEDLLAKIDSVGKDSRMKTEQLKNRAQVLEEQHAVNSQITRERLDALAQVAHTQANARQAHSDRMDGLERTVRLNEGAASTRIAELEVLTQRERAWSCPDAGCPDLTCLDLT
ncbi:hypothetical protein QJQ45_018706 [Haematococcus lacustris]|nr:hypothetical protein QJQ45_018706 [Haematococcus lacustris]